MRVASAVVRPVRERFRPTAASVKVDDDLFLRLFDGRRLCLFRGLVGLAFLGNVVPDRLVVDRTLLVPVVLWIKLVFDSLHRFLDRQGALRLASDGQRGLVEVDALAALRPLADPADVVEVLVPVLEALSVVHLSEAGRVSRLGERRRREVSSVPLLDDLDFLVRGFLEHDGLAAKRLERGRLFPVVDIRGQMFAAVRVVAVAVVCGLLAAECGVGVGCQRRGDVTGELCAGQVLGRGELLEEFERLEQETEVFGVLADGEDGRHVGAHVSDEATHVEG